MVLCATVRGASSVLGNCLRGQAGLGSSDFARRYFRNLVHRAMLLISVPGVLRWFSSPSFASVNYVFIYGCQALAWQVTPFGYPRINGCVLLPAAFRSLPRPSSPRYSQASAINPYSLDHIIVRMNKYNRLAHHSGVFGMQSGLPDCQTPT